MADHSKCGNVNTLCPECRARFLAVLKRDADRLTGRKRGKGKGK